MPAPKARSASAKTKVVNGRTVSARSKTGSAECSSAMSEWVRTRKEGTTPASVFAMLGKCRSMARAGKQATQHRAAGNEAKAQRYEALAAGKKGPISAKDRLALAKQKRADLMQARATGYQDENAVRGVAKNPDKSVYWERFYAAKAAVRNKEVAVSENRKAGAKKAAETRAKAAAVSKAKQDRLDRLPGGNSRPGIDIDRLARAKELRAELNAKRTAAPVAAKAFERDPKVAWRRAERRNTRVHGTMAENVANAKATRDRRRESRVQEKRYNAVTAHREAQGKPTGFGARLDRAKELQAELNAKRAGAGAAPVAAKAPLRKPRDPEIVAARKKVADDIRSQYRTAEQNVLSNPDYHRQSPALSGGLKDIRKSTYRQDVKAGVEKAKSRLPLRTTAEERRLDDKTQIAIRTDAAGSAGYRRGLRSVLAPPASPSLKAPGRGTPERLAEAANRSVLTDADKVALARSFAPAASLLQKMRQARYMSTIESGKGKGGIDREFLKQERERLGINADSIRSARGKQKLIAGQAAARGFNPSDVVSAGRKSAMAEIRDKYAKGGSMLSRGAGYYPSPGERLAAKSDYAKRMAQSASVVPKNVFLTPRTARANYRRSDLPETRQYLNEGDARKAAASRIKAEKIAKRTADERAAQRAANVATLQSRGKQTPERVALAEKARKFKSIASVHRSMGGFGMSRSEANAATKSGLLNAKRAPSPAAAPAVPRPSLKDQAAAHRAAKGDPVSRIQALRGKAGSRYTAARETGIALDNQHRQLRAVADRARGNKAAKMAEAQAYYDANKPIADKLSAKMDSADQKRQSLNNLERVARAAKRTGGDVAKARERVNLADAIVATKVAGRSPTWNHRTNRSEKQMSGKEHAALGRQLDLYVKDRGAYKAASDKADARVAQSNAKRYESRLRISQAAEAKRATGKAEKDRQFQSERLAMIRERRAEARATPEAKAASFAYAAGRRSKAAEGRYDRIKERIRDSLAYAPPKTAPDRRAAEIATVKAARKQLIATPVAQARIAEQRARAAVRERSKFSLFGGQTPNERPLTASPSPAKPSLRQQADAARAAKGTAAERAARATEAKMARSLTDMRYAENTTAIRDADHNIYATVREIRTRNKMYPTFEISGHGSWKNRLPGQERRYEGLSRNDVLGEARAMVAKAVRAKYRRPRTAARA